MKAAERMHRGYVGGRRVSVLARHLARLVPSDTRLLDVGCGDGQLSLLLAEKRPDLRCEGIEVQIRTETAIPVSQFDGRRIPFDDSAFDVLILIDVLHHSEDPADLLREACRVASRWIVIKDHILAGPLAGPILRFMDRVGNERHQVALPYDYWPIDSWQKHWKALGLRVDDYCDDLGLYPWPASWLFERSLHFIARLEVEAGNRLRC